MPSIPDTDLFNWVIGPVSRCGTYVAEETRVAAVLQRALVVLAGLDPFLQFARRGFQQASVPLEGIDQLIAHQKTLGPWAKELLAAELHPINSHALIGLWIAVEVAVEDTACLILIKEPAALGEVAAAGVRHKGLHLSAVDERTARSIVRAYERHLRQTLSVSGAYCKILSTLGIDVTLSDNVAVVLDEINYARNCLLHRGGAVDERSRVEAPSLDVNVGSEIVVTSARYLKYYDAVSEFSKALLAGVLESRHIRTRPTEAGTCAS
jgi:hypothetical protein